VSERARELWNRSSDGLIGLPSARTKPSPSENAWTCPYSKDPNPLVAMPGIQMGLPVPDRLPPTYSSDFSRFLYGSSCILLLREMFPQNRRGRVDRAPSHKEAQTDSLVSIVPSSLVRWIVFLPWGGKPLTEWQCFGAERPYEMYRMQLNDFSTLAVSHLGPALVSYPSLPCALPQMQ